MARFPDVKGHHKHRLCRAAKLRRLWAVGHEDVAYIPRPDADAGLLPLPRMFCRRMCRERLQVRRLYASLVYADEIHRDWARVLFE